jgi:N-acetylglucosamine kinase-like BadF-type ATPase
MRWCLGMDGGGSRTRACLADESGRIRARAETGPTNLHHAPPEEVRRRLDEIIGSVCAQAQVDRTQCVSAFLGMAGVTSEETRARFHQWAETCGLDGAAIQVDHDIRIALAGGLEGRPGIALIVGTGSSCYGRTEDGRHWQTGGWGALAADEGSGYYLGWKAIVTAVRMADGRLGETPLKARVFQWLGIESATELMRRIHEKEMTRTEIAAFAPQLLELAAGGDPPARQILQRGARHLADMVAANHARLPTGPHPDVVITGGLGNAETLYRNQILEAIQERLPSACIHRPLLAPVVGAVMLALEAAGCALNRERLENLEKTSS